MILESFDKIHHNIFHNQGSKKEIYSTKEVSYVEIGASLQQ